MYQQDSFGQAFKRGYNAMPPGVRFVITGCVIMFLLRLLGGSLIDEFTLTYLAFYADPIVTLTQPWRLVTYMFLHGGVFHLVFNMLWLWFLGRVVEEHLGTINFCVIYFGAGIGGALIDVVVKSSFGIDVMPTVGASGGVFGIMVAFAVLFPTWKLMLIFLPPIEARFLVAGLIALDLLLISSQDNVARVIHLGGAFMGFALLKLYYRGYRYDAWFSYFSQKFKSKPRPESPKNKNMSTVSDAEILDEEDQTELDRILEKISKSGYDGLSADEKRKLFELSKRDK